MMEHRNGLAGSLVDAIAKEATAQVAKGVVGAVKATIAALAAAIVALAYVLWSANPLATAALLLLSFLLGLAIGIAFGWRRAYGIKSGQPIAVRGAATGSAEGPVGEMSTESSGRGAGPWSPASRRSRPRCPSRSTGREPSAWGPSGCRSRSSSGAAASSTASTLRAPGSSRSATWRSRTSGAIRWEMLAAR